MKKPVTTGAEGLLGIIAEVVSKSGTLGYTKYMVRARGELWTASSAVSLQPGEMVSVMAVDGLKLVIEPADIKTGEREKTGVKTDERHPD